MPGKIKTPRQHAFPTWSELECGETPRQQDTIATNLIHDYEAEPEKLGVIVEDGDTHPSNSVRSASNLNDDTLSFSSAGLEKLGLLERAAEIKKLETEKKTYAFELTLDLIDVVSKVAVFVKLLVEDEPAGVLIWSGSLLGLSGLLALSSALWRLQQLRDMNFVAEHGYAKHWRSMDRLVGSGKVDPRVENDAAHRHRRHLQIRSSQAFFADLPWVIYGILRSATAGDADILILTSISFAAYAFGVKYASFVTLLKMVFCSGGSQTKLVYQSLPADIKIGTGTSCAKDTGDAIEESFRQCCFMLGCNPTFMIVVMNATCEHEKGIQKLVELAPGIPFTGGTTCQGVMTGQSSFRKDGVVAIWGLYDSEGTYVPEVWSHGDGNDPEKIQGRAAEIAKKARKKRTTRASFVFIMSAPGHEDLVLAGLVKSAIPVIGGSSADNDISGKWKQWASISAEKVKTGGKLYSIENNGCSACFVWCSAVVQSQLFTGYNATGKAGKITKTNGLRHILEIDGKPASKVYNEWTGGEWSKFLAEPEDSNILGPSSLFPLGQVCGEDHEGEPVYRSMHPHLLVKSTNSVTLFSDVQVGEKLCMMSGTKENIVNRIAGVATHIVNNSEFSLQEVRGAFVVFCAGCMMYADDQMDLSAQKLSRAIGGTPYLGVHTFGEQGQFADGSNRHGNLMFSAIVFSSKRKVARLLNVDTGKEIDEGDPAFEQILQTATICD